MLGDAEMHIRTRLGSLRIHLRRFDRRSCSAFPIHNNKLTSNPGSGPSTNQLKTEATIATLADVGTFQLKMQRTSTTSARSVFQVRALTPIHFHQLDLRVQRPRF